MENIDLKNEQTMTDSLHKELTDLVKHKEETELKNKQTGRVRLGWQEPLTIKWVGVRRLPAAQLEELALPHDIRQKQIENILNRLDALVSELNKCKRSITELHKKLEARPIVKQTNITEIGKGFRVKIPIPVTIEEYDDEVTASISEIELFASGSTEAEAILRLKKEVVSFYEELSKTPKRELGNLLMRHLRVLQNLVEKNG